MKLIVKPHKDACVIAAFAMASGLTVEYLIDKIGHDGTGVVKMPIAPDLNAKHYSYKEITVGFHIQEIIGVLTKEGKAVTPIELAPVSQLEVNSHRTHPIYFPDEAGNWKRFRDEIDKTKNGVIMGQSGNVGHAVAVDAHEGKVYDPDGEVFDYSIDNLLVRGFGPMCLWKVQSVC